MDVFRVRMNCLDHYQATPTKYDPQLRGNVGLSELQKEAKVPVIRVFGSTETGQKVCAHIHGALPYMYIEYDGGLDADDVDAFVFRLHLSVDRALGVSYRRNVYGESPKFVAKITLTKGIPFYGFHVGYRFFLKMYMLNPMVMNRLAELLLQGVIMGRKFQPYEAHLQYLLQWMTDYNLYGCDYIDARQVYFRCPVPQYGGEDEPDHLWHSESVPPAHMTDDAELPRASHCSLEVDICVQDILNRHQIQERQLHHDFVERLKPLPADLKLVHSMAGLWKDETKRRKKGMLDAAPGSSPFGPEVLVSMSADARNSQLPGWLHEEELREKINELVQDEQERGNGEPVTFDNFVEPVPFECTVKTMLQSVEDLYPESLLAEAALPDVVPQAEDPKSSIEVDEQRILATETGDDDLFPDDSDEDLLRELQQLETSAPGPSRPQGSSGPVDPINTGSDAGPDAGSDEQSASRLDNDRVLASVEGVYVSCLQSGRRVFPAFDDDLLSMAKEQGLLGRAPRAVAECERRIPAKRAAKTLLGVQEAKRLRVSFALGSSSEPSSVAESSAVQQVEVEDSVAKTSDPTGLSLPPSSQLAEAKSKAESFKANGGKLMYPIVKGPLDGSTMLRLSQQTLSQQTASQRSQEKASQKHVSFDIPPSATPGPSGSGTDLSQPRSSSLSSQAAQEDEPGLCLDLGCAPRPGCNFFILSKVPPSATEVMTSMQSHGRPDVIYQDAFYSQEKDVPQRMREYAGHEFRIEGNSVPYLPEFDETGSSAASFGLKHGTSAAAPATEAAHRERGRRCTLRSWEMAEMPPTSAEVEAWWARKQETAADQGPRVRSRDAELKPYLSQMEGPTPRNKHGFKYSQKKKSSSVELEAQYMSTMSLEVHVNTRGKLFPNPEEDEVQCIFWCSKSDEEAAIGESGSAGMQSGIVVLSEDGSVAQRMQKQTGVSVMQEATELELMLRMVEIVRNRDPDILTGYEVHGSSWGYLVERARFKYDFNLCDEFSRMKSQSFGRFGKEADRWGFNTTSTIRVTGRHMINIWRAMRSELNLLQYTMENVVWHLLHRRLPHHSWRTLTDWYVSGRPRDLSKLLRHYLTRTRLDMDILEANEIIPRTSEQARLLGVDFFSVFSRGSQFKVESIMFRIAKAENLALVSPDRRQVGGQNALECLPLVMEPQSAFYTSPVLVLDFQSLYPSVMIAYNYCYSTFLGRIKNWRGSSKMGFSEYKRQERLLELLKDEINVAPNGIMYCKAEVRKSLLAKMLTEILETRVMVKSGMKQDKEDKTLQQLLKNRQLALKLLANVTYGYTSASFSGRMPCSEIADSIVQTGRETLERAIALIHSVDRWKAEVVYGDTDSLFVHLRGRSKDQAFEVGNEMVKAITDMNPRPVKLKFEKVYLPCVLLAKKRYVGYKYETKDQAKAEFEAKGMETVRRDGTPAEQMMEEKALKILFETADLSQVKAYFQKQCDKIMRGAVSVQDFCFAREVKLGTYSDKGPPPPGALISSRKMAEDSRAEPQYGERVPYVVTKGAPGARLIDRCVAPEELLGKTHLQLDAEYYISKNLIPPLERIFNLVGANVRQWYDEMPKVQRIRRVVAENSSSSAQPLERQQQQQRRRNRKVTLESYMKAAGCVVCGARTGNEAGMCDRCIGDAAGSMVKLRARLGREQAAYGDTVAVCRSCAGLAPVEPVECDSRDCPVLYTRVKQAARYAAERTAVEPALACLADNVEIADLGLDW